MIKIAELQAWASVLKPKIFREFFKPNMTNEFDLKS